MPLQAKDPWLLNLLAVARTRPGMWIPGPETARNLQTYLVGYRQARGDLGLPAHGAGEEALLDDFTQWMKARLGTLKRLSWTGYVEEVDDGPENVHTFFALFEEFLGQKGLSLPSPEDAGWPADDWGIDGDG